MKKLPLLKSLFLIHLIIFAGYFYYQIKIKKDDPTMQSHSIKEINKNDKLTQTQVKPIGMKIDNSQNQGSEINEADSSNENVNNTITQDDTVDQIIQRFGVNYITPSEKLSVLMLIIQENRDDLFKKYINEFRNIDHQNIYGASALVMASSSSDMEYVAELLKKGANPNIKFNKKNFTILMDASMEGNVELISSLLSYGANINEVDSTGKSALIYAAIEGHKEVIQVLLKNGANSKIKDLKNLSAMDYLILNKHKSLYDLLK